MSVDIEDYKSAIQFWRLYLSSACEDLSLKLVEMEGEFAAWHAGLKAMFFRLFIHLLLSFICIYYSY